MFYTLTDAAKAIGKTRQAVQAAIKKGTISARKNALGQWEVDPAELHRVYPPITLDPQTNCGNLTEFDRQFESKKDEELYQTRSKLEAAERLLQELKNHAEELRQERDDWKQQAHEWMLQAKALPEGKPRRRGLFSWLWS